MRNLKFNVQEFFKEKWRKFKKFFKSFAVKFVEKHEKIKSKYNVGRIFKQQEKFRNIIYEKSKTNILKNKFFIFSICCFAISLCIDFFLKDEIKTECAYRFILAFLFGSFLMFFIFLLLSMLDAIFNYVLKFIFYGTCIFFILGFCFYSLLLVITKNIIISYYLMIFLMVILWSYISTLNDLEVAKLGNSIISALVTLILEFTGNLREAIVLDNDVLGNLKDPDLLSTITSHENIWKILLFPFVAATLIGLISCEYKEFWIKRYGNYTEEIYTKYE